MANFNAKGKRAAKGPEMVQRCRAAVLNAFDAVESRGKVLSEILADEFEKNPIKFLDAASKWAPKEIQAEVNHITSASDLTDDELADIATGSRDGADKAPISTAKPDSVH